jgi:uncharacterized protein YjaZ
LTHPTPVSVNVNGARAIPEVGVGGFTDPGTGSVTMWLDPKSRIGVRATLTTWLPQGLAHELDHAKRILDGPGYGTTLGQAIVSEGLADAFSRQVFPATPRPPWTQALGPEELVRLTSLAIMNSDTTDSPDVHGQWFFGAGGGFGGTERVPRWAGYSIGASVVDRYLQAHPDATPASLTLVPAEVLLAAAA